MGIGGVLGYVGIEQAKLKKPAWGFAEPYYYPDVRS